MPVAHRGLVVASQQIYGKREWLRAGLRRTNVATLSSLPSLNILSYLGLTIAYLLAADNGFG